MKTQAAQVASIIKKHLKQNGIDCRVRSENYSGGDSVNVYVYDVLPKTLEMIKDYCSQFEYGHFDGMTDSYDYSNIREDIPQVRFLFVNAEYSDDLRQDCWEWLKDYYDFENAPESWRDASNFRCEIGMFTYGDMLISNELCTGFRGFWYTKKQRLAA